MPTAGPGITVLWMNTVAGIVRRGARTAVNALLPIVVGLFLVSMVDYSPDPVPPPVRMLGMLVGLGQGVALYWRHRHPLTVTAITVVGGAIVQLIAPLALFPYAGMVAMWSLATLHPPRRSLPALAGLLGVTTLGWPGLVPAPFAVQPENPVPTEDTAFALAVVVAVWALAEARRSRRAAIGQASRQAAEREQARLARELHDVIAHSVSVIVVQAAAGDDVFDHDPAAARQALRSIDATGREALAELRRLLAAIGPADSAPDRRPQPDLTRLDELAEPLRSVGLTVDMVKIPPTMDANLSVPIGVQLSAYRIVQEALTNVLRHSRAQRIEVRLEIKDDWLAVGVSDDATGRPVSFQPGRGINGMRERAALLGGSLDAGPHADGGFHVRARLPLQPVR